MGRSVTTPNDGIVAYADCSDFEEYYFEDYQEMLMLKAHALWPSLKPTSDEWPFSHFGGSFTELKALLENSHCYFGVSGYCGLVAIWITPKPDCEHEALANKWIDSVASKFHQNFGDLRPLGFASNGSQFFEKKENAQ